MVPRLSHIGLGIVAAVAAVVVVAFALVALLHSSPGERWLAGKIEEASDQQVEFDGMRLAFPFTFKADYLRLKDRGGTWLTASDPVLAWDPARLWRRVLDIERLDAERIDVARLPEGDGGGSTDWTFEWPDFALNLGALSAPVFLAEAVVGEALILDVAGTFQMRPGGGLVDVHVRSEGGGLARLAGTAGRDYLDLRWYLRIPRLDRWSRLAGLPMAGELTGSGLVAGRLPQAVVSGTIATDRAHIGDLRWDGLSLTARIIPERDIWRLALSAEARSPRLGDRPAPLPVVTLSAAGDLDMAGRLRLGMARVTGDGLVLSASGVVAEAGRRADLRIEADLDDIADYVPASGRASVRAVIAGDLLAPDLDGEVRAWGGKMAIGNALLDRLLGATPSASSRFHLGPDRVLSLAHGQVLGQRASLALDGRVADRLGLWGRLRIPELSVLAGDLSGSATAWGRIGGALSAPQVTGMARLDQVAAARTPPAEGDVSFDLALPQGGTVTADLRVAGRPVDGSARLVLGQPFRIRDLRLHSDGARLAGDLAFEQGGVRGRLNGSIPDLQSWQNLIGRPVSGRVDAEAVLDPAAGQSLGLSVRASGLIAEGVTAATAQMNARLTGLARRPSGRASLSAGEISAGGVILERVRLNAVGDAGAFRFDLDGEGEGETASVAAAGTARIAGSAGEALFDRIRLSRRHRDITLAAPARLAWGPARLALAPAEFAIDGGRVTLAGRLDGRAIAADGVLTGVPLDVIALVVPELDAVGTVAGKVSLGGTLDQPTARFDLIGKRVGFAAAAEAGLGRMGIDLSGEWRDNRLTARLAARDGQTLRLTAEGGWQDGNIRGDVALAGDLARLTEALPLAGHGFAGRIDGSATIAGTLAAPRVDGGARITGGRYENYEQGIVIAGLAARLDVDGERIAVEASGNDGGRGRMTLTGKGNFDGTWQGDLRFDRFTALRRDDIEAAASGRLDLAGDGLAGRIGGAVTIPRAEIDIGRLKGGGPVVIDVVEINRPGAMADKPPEQAAEMPLSLALDVAVGIEHAFVRGRGLDSEWQGDLDVAGTAADPRVTGRLTAARGDYQFLGKSFRLSPESAVVFAGGDPENPDLDVSATTRATDITARVDITGSASDPELTIASEPPLPQDEVLARVLFNRGLGSLSAFQQIQLAQMAATGLTGKGGGFDPIGDIRGLLGLDVLDVGGEGGNGPTLSAGKYIGRDTFVRVEQGVEGFGGVTVERELGGGFSVETEIGQQSGGGLGLTWRKDY
jgi:translocation and assembly module TamB